MGPVVLFIPSLGGGGAERVAVTIANGFVERGLHVLLIVGGGEGKYSAEIDSRVNVSYLGKKSVMQCLWALRTLLLQRKPSAVYAFMLHANIVALLANLLSGSRTKVIVSERVAPSLPEYRAGLKSGIMRYCRARLYGTAHKIHAVSHGVAVELCEELQIPQQKVTVIYNPLEARKILELSRCSDLEISLPSRPFIVAMGRLEPQKDFDTLIHAFALIRRQWEGELIILGEGSLKADLQQTAAALDVLDYVKFPGFLKNPFNVMAASEVFVLSSLSEGLPNSLIQALIIGIPVVATECKSGPDEILENGRWGRLVPVGDHAQMAEAILQQINLQTTADMDLALERFDPVCIVQQYLSLAVDECD